MSFKKACCLLTFQPHHPFPLFVVQLSCHFKLPPTLPTMTNLINPPLSNQNFRQKTFVCNKLFITQFHQFLIPNFDLFSNFQINKNNSFYLFRENNFFYSNQGSRFSSAFTICIPNFFHLQASLCTGVHDTRRKDLKK